MVVLRRDADGRVTSRMSAPRGTLTKDGWSLEDATIADLRTGSVERRQRLDWPGGITPKTLKALELHPRAMSMTALWESVREQGPGIAPPYLYVLWLNRRIAEPFVTGLLLLLAATVTPAPDRRGGILVPLATGLGAGFSYFVIDGIILALGEAGLLDARLAAWGPLVAYAAALAAATLRRDIPGRARARCASA